MNVKAFLILSGISLTVLLSGCSLGPDTDFPLNSLDGVLVYKIEQIGDKLFFCTDNGVYVKAGPNFQPFGLQGKAIIDIVKLGPDSYLAAKRITHYGDVGEITLFRGNESGWEPHMGNYGGEDGSQTAVRALVSRQESPGVIFAAGDAHVAKSSNAGENWQVVEQSWGALGFTYFLEFQTGYPDTLWAGGSSVVDSPIIKRSIDGGDTWEYVLWQLEVETENGLLVISTESYDITFHPDDPDQVMVAMGGLILKTTDFGQSWTIPYKGPAGFYTFARSAVDPEVLYVSGRNGADSLFVLTTNDFGENWQELELPESLQSTEDIYVGDMVSVIKNGYEVLYFGTNKGLYSYYK